MNPKIALGFACWFFALMALWGFFIASRGFNVFLLIDAIWCGGFGWLFGYGPFSGVKAGKTLETV